MRKILLLVCTLLSVSSMAKITGPKHNLEVKAGLMLVNLYKPKFNEEQASFSLEKEKTIVALTNTASYSVIFKKEIATRSSLAFGPKLSLNVHLEPKTNSEYIGGALLTQGVLAYQYDLKDKLKLFTEIETGLGANISKGSVPKNFLEKNKEAIEKKIAELKKNKEKQKQIEEKDQPAKAGRQLDVQNKFSKKGIEDLYTKQKTELKFGLAYNISTTIGLKYKGLKAGLYAGYGINGILGTSLSYEF